MKSKVKTIDVRLLVLTAMLITMATILHIMERALPVLPLNAKLGLANIITVAVIVMLGPKTAFTVAVTRTILGALLYTGFGSGFAMSFSGAIFSWALMAIVYYFAQKSISLVGLSLVGAFAHNLAQLFVASLFLDTIGIFALFPYLMFFAVPTGIMVGYAAGFLVRAMAQVPNLNYRL